MKFELRNPVYPVTFVGGPADGKRSYIGLQETSDILDLGGPLYKWREGTFAPYIYDFTEKV